MQPLQRPISNLLTTHRNPALESRIVVDRLLDNFDISKNRDGLRTAFTDETWEANEFLHADFVASSTPTWCENALTRRRFMKNVAVATTAGGLILCSDDREARAGFWFWVGATAAAAVIGWAVHKICDYAWDRLNAESTASGAKSTSRIEYSRSIPIEYKLKESDLKEVKSPSPTRSSFHNEFSMNYEIVNTKKHITPRQLKGYGVDFGVEEYVRATDLNYPELLRIKFEFNEDYGVLLPFTERVAVKPANMPKVIEIMEQYRFRAGDYKVEYLNALVDKNGTHHIGVGATVDGKAKYYLGAITG